MSFPFAFKPVYVKSNMIKGKNNPSSDYYHEFCVDEDILHFPLHAFNYRMPAVSKDFQFIAS